MVDDKTLVDAIVNKNSAALKEMMDTYGDRLLKSAYLITRNNETAQDVVQETFTSAYFSMRLFKGESRLYTWLYSIMLNHCKKVLRNRWLRNVDYTNDVQQKSTSYSHNSTNGIEVKLDIENAINSLPENYRRLAVLFYYEDFTIKEISEITGKKEGTIKSSLSRLRVIIREHLGGGIRYEQE